ncbi:hypothetical protein HY844_01075 [Candidatus Berkelbacteria bacterium]|nr:hypothetical protein [Candidatus Berkelbacteria bacterium]
MIKGHLHPLTIISNQIVNYYKQYGFEVHLGNEVVTTEENFDSLNIPINHPARAEFDTFYLKDGRTLRAHTTSMYLGAMKDRKPPVRILFPGKCYRNEATDSTHNFMFHQIDGLVIDQKTNLGNLIASLEGLFTHLIGPDIEFRIRNSHFPFTEPSIELDIKISGSNWLEMLGAGMLNPKVIAYYGLDPDKYQGYAFGIGLERMINVISGVDDVRYNTSGDYRYIGQY